MTAINSVLSAQVGIQIATAAAPDILEYTSDEIVYELGVAVDANHPRFTGEVDEWSSTPALPDGLELDPETGVISGTPGAETRYLETFTITASNAMGEDSYELGIWVFDRIEITMISRGIFGQPSYSGAGAGGISTDGSHIVLATRSSDLPGGGQWTRILKYSVLTGEFELVNLGNDGSYADDRSRSPRINGDGTVIVFESDASNLVEDQPEDAGLFIWEQAANPPLSCLPGTPWPYMYPDVSDDGRFVVYGARSSSFGVGGRIHLHDRDTRETRVLENLPSGFDPSVDLERPRISGDGNTVVYVVREKEAPYRHVYSYDIATGEIFYVNSAGWGRTGNSQSWGGTPSYDGSQIALNSWANQLAKGPFDSPGADAFVRDRPGRELSLASRSESNVALGGIVDSMISSEARFVLFSSWSRLDLDDERHSTHVYRFDRRTGEVLRLNVGPDGEAAHLGVHGSGVSISGDGRRVVFNSKDDLTTGEATNTYQAYLAEIRELPQL